MTGRKGSEKKKKATGFYLAWGGFITAIVLIAGLFYSYYRFTQFTTIASFNGGSITRDEFTRALQLQSGKYDPMIWKNPSDAMKIKMEILDQLVEDKILSLKAEKLGIKVDEGEFANELLSYKSGYTDESFAEVLKAKGIDYKDWAETKRQKFLVQKLIEQEVIGKINNSPEEIKKYYDQHKDEFSHPEQVSARHILVSSWEEAEKVSNDLAGGGNFAAIAKERSISPERWQGGDLGYFSRGTFPEVFDRVCFNLPVGEVSQAVKSEYGYHIFKVTDKRGPAKESLEEAKKYIDLQLKREKGAEATKNWTGPAIDSAKIKINEDLLEKIEVSANDKT